MWVVWEGGAELGGGIGGLGGGGPGFPMFFGEASRVLPRRKPEKRKKRLHCWSFELVTHAHRDFNTFDCCPDRKQLAMCVWVTLTGEP